MAREKNGSLAIKILAWLIVLAAAAGVGAYLYLQEPVYEVTATTVENGAVERTVAAIASGTVMPAQKSMVAAAGLGTISAVHVEEGDTVEAGALLVELDHEELDAQVALAEANLAVGESRLEQARMGEKIAKEVSASRLKQAQAQWDAAKADYDRIKSLADQNAVSKSDFDKVALAYRVSREGVAVAETGQRENLVRQEEIRSAEKGIEQLHAAIDMARAMRDKALVRAPFGGMVADILLEEGEAVAMGIPLLHLVRMDDCYIEAPFDEANTAQVATGQPARIEVDAYPDETFTGEVSYVAPTISFNRDLSRTLNVKVNVLEGKDKLLPGMSVDVTVISEKKEGVPFVPSESLIRDEFAYVIDGGRIVQRDIVIGIGNWETREIVEGLRAGETIVTSVTVKGLEAGCKVRVVDELAGY